jgi:hypothetical protein
MKKNSLGTKVGILISLSLACSMVQAWTVALSNEYGTYQYDETSISGPDNDRKIHTKVNFNKERPDKLKSMLVYYSIDCSGNTSIRELMKGYTEYGLTGDEKVYPMTAQKREEIKPELVSKAYYDIVCSKDISKSTESTKNNVDKSIFYRKIPVITASQANTPGDAYYSIPLQFYNPKLGNYRQACQFEFNTAGKASGAYQINFPYEFGVSVNSLTVDDMKIDWDNKETLGSVLVTKLLTNLPVCIVSGDIYLSEIYASGWKQLEDKLNNLRSGSSQCLRSGMNFKKMPYYLNKQDAEVKYPSIFHPVAQNVISECEKIINQDLKTNYQCTVGEDKRATKCEEGWYENRNGQFFKLSSYKDLIEAKLGNRQISVMGFETKQANDEYKNLVAQREAEAAKKAEEAEKYRQWLESPEGKKHLAEEAANAKKAEQERIKAENAEKLRLSKLGLPKFKVSQKREWDNGWEKWVSRVVIQSLDGDVVINKIIVNRGNCRVNFLTTEQGFAVRLPRGLKFGESLKVDVDRCDLLETSVETNRGNLSFTFN